MNSPNGKRNTCYGQDCTGAGLLLRGHHQIPWEAKQWAHTYSPEIIYLRHNGSIYNSLVNAKHHILTFTFTTDVKEKHNLPLASFGKNPTKTEFDLYLDILIFVCRLYYNIFKCLLFFFFKY